MTDKHLVLLTTLVESQGTHSKKLDNLNSSFIEFRVTQSAIKEDVKDLTDCVIRGAAGHPSLQSRMDMTEAAVQDIRSAKKVTSLTPKSSNNTVKIMGAIITSLIALIGAIVASQH